MVPRAPGQPRDKAASRPRWTKDCDELVRLTADGMLDADISALLGRSPVSVYLQRAKLGVFKNGQRREWTQEEARLLHELAPLYTCQEIGALLGRTEKATDHKLRKLGIERPAAFYIARGLWHRLYPPELKELIALQKQLRTRLKNEEHRGIAGAPVQASRCIGRSSAEARS